MRTRRSLRAFQASLTVASRMVSPSAVGTPRSTPSASRRTPGGPPLPLQRRLPQPSSPRRAWSARRARRRRTGSSAAIVGGVATAKVTVTPMVVPSAPVAVARRRAAPARSETPVRVPSGISVSPAGRSTPFQRRGCASPRTVKRARYATPAVAGGSSTSPPTAAATTLSGSVRVALVAPLRAVRTTATSPTALGVPISSAAADSWRSSRPAGNPSACHVGQSKPSAVSRACHGVPATALGRAAGVIAAAGSTLSRARSGLRVPSAVVSTRARSQRPARVGVPSIRPSIRRRPSGRRAPAASVTLPLPARVSPVK